MIVFTEEEWENYLRLREGADRYVDDLVKYKKVIVFMEEK